jgi:hypothetical protein
MVRRALANPGDVYSKVVVSARSASVENRSHGLQSPRFGRLERQLSLKERSAGSPKIEPVRSETCETFCADEMNQFR